MIDQFIIGLLAWTLLEYLLHRFEHRFRPEQHNVHHKYPADYSVGPSWLAIAVYFQIAAPVFGLLGGPLATAAGFVAGYALYAWVHYSCHHRRPTWKWLMRLHRRHAIHHVRPDIKFGVSTSMWDIIFRTEERKP